MQGGTVCIYGTVGYGGAFVLASLTVVLLRCTESRLVLASLAVGLSRPFVGFVVVLVTLAVRLGNTP